MCLGIPGRVAELFTKDGLPMGKVTFGGILKDICLAYTPEASIDDYVLVHVGFAISVIDEAEADEVFALLKEIEQAADAEDASREGPPSETMPEAAPDAVPNATPNAAPNERGRS